PVVWLGASVAAQDVRPGDRDDPDLVGIRVAQIVSRLVEHDGPHRLAGKGQTDRTDAAVTVDRIQRRDACRLGPGVRLEDADARRLLEPAEELDGHRRRTAHGEIERAQVAPGGRNLEKRAADRRHARNSADPLRLDDVPEVRDPRVVALPGGGPQDDMRASKPGYEPRD